jgi:hypothetical protein
LQFLEEPSDLTVNAGFTATFNARAIGLPRPRYQWFFDEQSIPGATGSSFSITNVSSDRIGRYHVVITNGVEAVSSRVVRLYVTTNETNCYLIAGLRDLTATVGESQTFAIVTGGNPSCSYQWYFNGDKLSGQMSSSLELWSVQLSDSGTYAVVASNYLGTCSASATLTVVPKPLLYISEVMAWPSGGHPDWFEVTSYDTNPIGVLGYRFDDEPGSFDGAFTISNSVTLMPGESMIFVQSTTPDVFQNWWGVENLPAGLKILPWLGFSLKNTNGDQLWLWSPTTTEELVYIYKLSYANPIQTLSFQFERTESFQEESVVGVNGAFCAAEGADIGSPGYTTNPTPRITAIWRLGNETIIRWRAPAGTPCRVEMKDTLAPGPWASMGSFVADCTIMTDTNSAAGRQRFYRLAPGP